MERTTATKWKATRKDTRLKYYGEELVEVFTASRPIFNPDNIPSEKENVKDIGKFADIKKDDDDDKKENGESLDSLARSKRRARKAVYDYCMCNEELDTFVTFTISPDANIDRYDVDACVKRLGQWLSNRVKRKGLKYVFVCELHKDGAAHFHGLVNGSAVRLVDSGHKDKRGKTVYNVADWKHGFTTAVRCYGYRSDCVKYITKYITKAENKVCGRWYLSGGDLKKPRYEYLDGMDAEEFADAMGDGWEFYEHEVENAQLTVKIATKTRPSGEFVDKLADKGG